MKKILAIFLILILAVPLFGQEAFKSAGRTSVRNDTTTGSKAFGRLISTKEDSLLWMGTGFALKQVATWGDTFALMKLKLDTLAGFSTDSVFTKADMVFLQNILFKASTTNKSYWIDSGGDTVIVIDPNASNNPSLYLISTDKSDTLRLYHNNTDGYILTEGKLVLGGHKKTNNETLTFDFETVANEVGLASGTGVTNFDLQLINFETAGKAVIGDSLRVEESALFKQKAVVNDSFRVEKTSIQKGNAQFDGKVVIDDSIRVNGNEEIKGKSIIDDSLRINGNLEVKGKSVLDDSIRTNGNLEVKGKAVVDDSLRNNGTTRLVGTVTAGATATPVVISTAGKITTADTISTNTGLKVGNPTVADQQNASIIMTSDFDSDAGQITKNQFTITRVGNGTPANGFYDITSTQGYGYRFDKRIYWNGGIEIIPDPNYLSFSGRGFVWASYSNIACDYNSSTKSLTFAVPSDNKIVFEGWGYIANAGNYFHGTGYFGNKNVISDVVWTRENDLAHTDSSGRAYILAGNSRITQRATDADSTWWTVDTDTARLGSNNPVLIHSAALALRPSTSFKIGAAQWDVAGTDSINGASIGARTIPMKAIADSQWNSITLGNDAENVSGQLNFVASDNDQANIAINTSDQLAFTGGSGGYTFDDSVRVAKTTELIGNTVVGKTTAGANLTVNATEGAEAITDPMVTGGWTLGYDTGGWSITAGVLTKTASTGTQTATAVTGMTVTPTTGRKYKVVIVCSAAANSLTYTLGGVSGTTITATTITDYITANTTAKIIFSGGATTTCTITSLSIKELTDDTGELICYGDINASTLSNLKGTKVAYLTSTGRLGIGTVNPTSKLHVTGDIALTTGAIQLDTGYNIDWSNGYSLGRVRSTALSFNANASEVLTLLNSGNVGIGTITPQHKTSIVGATPILNIVDSDVNKLRTSVAQATDTSSITIDASTTFPSINFAGSDGDKYLISGNTSDQALFQNAGGGYIFDGLVGINQTSPLANSLTLGGKSAQIDWLLTRENVPAGTDSSIYGHISSGVPYLRLNAADGDTLSLWHDGSSGYIAGHTGLGLKVGNTLKFSLGSGTLTSYANIDPSAVDTYTLGSTAGWNSAYITDNICLGGKGETATFYVSKEKIFAGTDSSIVSTVDDGDGKTYYKAGDGDSLVVTCANDSARIKSNNPISIAGGITNTGILTQKGSVTFKASTSIWDSLITHSEVSKIDSGASISLATGVSGWGELLAGDNQEWAHFRFTSAGKVTLIANSANVDTVSVGGGTALKVDIYDAGTGIAIRNNLAKPAKKVAVKVNYYTP